MIRSSSNRRDGRRERAASPADEPTERPSVSIVVPVYNDPDGLRETLESLTGQTYPDAAHEILVVDNDSTDETPDVAREYADAFDRVEWLLEDDRQSSYAARNAGIRRASGEVFAFVDADMVVPADWLVDAIDAMEAADAEYVGCNVEMVPDANAHADGLVDVEIDENDEEEENDDGTSLALAEKYNLLTGFPIEYFVDELGFAPTCCLLVRRSVIEDVGPFDPRLVSSGDREFGHRVRDSGRELHFAEDVTMYHPTRTTADAILRKARRVGRGYYQLRRYHPKRYGGRLRCALNPLNYVPPNPLSIRRRIDEWDALSRRERAGFYLLSYGRTLSNGLGRLEESVRPLGFR